MEPSEVSDQKPDHGEFEEFWNLSQKRLHSFICKQLAVYEIPICGSEADDLVRSVVQDAFRDLYGKWNSYDSALASRYTWLIHMAKGRLKRELRAWERHCRRRDKASEARFTEAIDDVDNWLTDIVFQQYCDGLVPEWGRVVQLKADGFTNEEIGEMVDKSPASVKGITQRLRQKARDLPSPI